jgi:hypothetical protein
MWVFVAETELALARLTLEEGRPEEALVLAEWALAAHAAIKSPAREALSYTVKARALRQLQALVARAIRDGMKRVELEARLLLVELDPGTDAVELATELLAIRQEASRLGYRGLLPGADAQG